MAISEIGICNNALALLGASAIRSFDEDNKRARLCKNLYDVSRDFLLRSYDWPFARSFAKLQKIDTEDIEVPPGMNLFGLPASYVRILDVYPRGSKTPWEIIGRYLCSPMEDVRVYYTRKEVSVVLFSCTFVSALSVLLAYRMCPSITQDEALTKALYEQYKIEIGEFAANDANEGNDYIPFDTDPNNDSFVTGEHTSLLLNIQDTEAEDAG
jgi:hypothetical protein